MKSLDALFDEIRENKELQDRFAAAVKNPEKLIRFCKEQGCETTIADIKKKLSEISNDELEMVSGGLLDPEYAYHKGMLSSGELNLESDGGWADVGKWLK